MLTQERLKEILDYNPETGIFTWKIEPPNRPYLKGKEAGYCDGKGYIRIEINCTAYRAHRLAFLFIEGYLPENSIDHKDRNKSNNAWLNLREASRQCQGRNCGLVSHNTSGIKGVYWDKCKGNGKWRVQITIDKKHINLGKHPDFTEAVAHRLAAEQCLNWNECDENSSAYNFIKEYTKR